MKDARRDLPSVSSLLETRGVKALLDQHPRRVVLEAVRATVDAAREGGTRPARDAQGVGAIAGAAR